MSTFTLNKAHFEAGKCLTLIALDISERTNKLCNTIRESRYYELRPIGFTADHVVCRLIRYDVEFTGGLPSYARPTERRTIERVDLPLLCGSTLTEHVLASIAPYFDGGSDAGRRWLAVYGAPESLWAWKRVIE